MNTEDISGKLNRRVTTRLIRLLAQMLSTLGVFIIVRAEMATAQEVSFEEIPNEIPSVAYNSAEWGDLNGDGFQDLLLLGIENSKVFLNDGRGRFSDSGIRLVGAHYGAAAIADYNNDGRFDIAISGFNHEVADNRTTIYRNSGNGTFADIGAQIQGVNRGHISWADFDNDGDKDLLVIGNPVNSMSVLGSFAALYENVGGDFVASSSQLEGEPTTSATWGDFDLDGDLDVVIGGSTTRLYENNAGILRDTGAALPSSHWGQVVSVDCDTDGDLDLIVARSSPNGSSVCRNSFGAFVCGNTSFSLVETPSISVTDFDLDGRQDVAIAGPITSFTNLTDIWRNIGECRFKRIESSIPGIRGGILRWGLANGDSVPDLLVNGVASEGERHFDLSKVYSTLLPTPTPTAAPTVTPTPTPTKIPASVAALKVQVVKKTAAVSVTQVFKAADRVKFFITGPKTQTKVGKRTKGPKSGRSTFSAKFTGLTKGTYQATWELSRVGSDAQQSAPKTFKIK
jgi:hypothetical protein